MAANGTHSLFSMKTRLFILLAAGLAAAPAARADLTYHWSYTGQYNSGAGTLTVAGTPTLQSVPTGNLSYPTYSISALAEPILSIAGTFDGLAINASNGTGLQSYYGADNLLITGQGARLDNYGLAFALSYTQNNTVQFIHVAIFNAGPGLVAGQDVTELGNQVYPATPGMGPNGNINPDGFGTLTVTAPEPASLVSALALAAAGGLVRCRQRKVKSAA